MLYILDDDQNPTSIDDVLTWGAWMETADRTVAMTTVAEGITVSTQFLGLDHQFGDGPPLLFETMVFGGAFDGEIERHSTRKAAKAGHEWMVARIAAAHRAKIT